MVEAMEFGNIGGIALILAALVWLAVFVPSWARRSELRQIESRVAVKRNPPTQLMKLERTRNLFALVAVLLLAGTVAAAILGSTGLAVISAIPAALATLVAIAAGKRLNRTLSLNYEARRSNRERLATELDRRGEVVSGWTPNPLPKPLNAPKRGELVSNAEVIQLPTQQSTQQSIEHSSEPQTQSLNSAEILEIMRRRRAI